jgi:Porin subfamily
MRPGLCQINVGAGGVVITLTANPVEQPGLVSINEMGVVVSYSGIFKFRTAALIALAAMGLQTAGLAAPVEYVKICDAYGAGFFNIPGTDTCTRLSVGAQAGFGSATTNFKVNPDFDVRGSGFVYGVNGMALFGVAHTNFAVGPRVGYLGGNMGGSTFYPTSGGIYSVDNKGALYGDVVLQYAPTGLRGGSLRAFGGLVDTRTQTAYGVLRTFALQGSDSSTDIGVTAGAGFNAPISGFNGFSLTGEVRWIGGLTQSFNVPGTVWTNRDIVTGTVGFEYSFASDRSVWRW